MPSDKIIIEVTTIMEKIVGTLDATITAINYLILTTEIENGVIHCSIKDESSRFCYNPSWPP